MQNLFEERYTDGLAVRAYVIVLLLDSVFVYLRVASETQHKGFNHQSNLILNDCVILYVRPDAAYKHTPNDS